MNTPSFNPSALKDPVALQTSWGPLKPGGTNIKTRKLVQDHNRLMFKASLISILFGGMFLLFGGIALIMGIGFSGTDDADAPTVIAMILFSLVFIGIGFSLLKRSLTPIVFDRTSQLFWHGKGKPAVTKRGNGKTKVIPFNDIYALQIISEWCQSTGQNNRSYYSYELNLVLKDGSRYNVVDHGDIKALNQDARKLARFIEVPLWNGE